MQASGRFQSEFEIVLLRIDCVSKSLIRGRGNCLPPPFLVGPLVYARGDGSLLLWLWYAFPGTLLWLSGD